MNPLHTTAWHENLSLTSNWKGLNLQAKSQNESILFDPTITTKNNLTECFRIFTDLSKASKNPAQCRVTARASLRHATTEVYTDGACINNGKENAKSGSGTWFRLNDQRNMAIKNPEGNQSNQVGELIAIITAIKSTPNFIPLKIISDSKYMIDRLMTHLTQWENHGWIQVKNAELFQETAYLLRQRSATTAFQWVKGHEGTLGKKKVTN